MTSAEKTLPSASDLRPVVGTVPGLDLWSFTVIVVMTAGFPIAGWLHHAGRLPAWAAVLIGIWLMNLSFTAWHEPAHGNLSRHGWVNTLFGWIASFASCYPGYYARRREHLIHHRYEGRDGWDPVYPRIQKTSFWGFPFRLFFTAINPGPTNVPDTELPITGKQRLSDMISNLAALAVIVGGTLAGFGWSILWVWVIPRLVVYLVHAYYICWFPHNEAGAGYTLHRIRRDLLPLRFATVNQHLHGIHHKWTWIPWHKYRRILRTFPEIAEVMAARRPAPVPATPADATR